MIETENALTVPIQSMDTAGTYALAVLDDAEFEERLAVLKRGRERIATIQRQLMIEGEDYGLIPGTPKPTLYKPGAEKLAQIYRLAARLEATFREGDNEKSPPLTYDAVCYLHLGSFDGPVVASGHGTANSWEKRYRRGEDKVCPSCGVKGSIIKSKAEYGGGWFCWPKKGGCNTKFPPDEPAITEQSTSGAGEVVGQWDLGVTLLKMAEKRAFVDAVLRATASSGLFTQDLAEEPIEDEEGAKVTKARRSRSQPESLPPAEVGPAEDVAPVGKGGRQTLATPPQIASVKAYSKGLGLGPDGLIAIYNETFGTDHTIPDDRVEGSAALIAILESTDSEDLGSLIQRLAAMAESKAE